MKTKLTHSSDHGQSLIAWMDEGSGSGHSLTGNVTEHYPEYFGGVSLILYLPSFFQSE